MRNLKEKKLKILCNPSHLINLLNNKQLLILNLQICRRGNTSRRTNDRRRKDAHNGSEEKSCKEEEVEENGKEQKYGYGGRRTRGRCWR